MKVALVQMNSQQDKAANLREARRLIEAAVAAENPDLVVLPEYWACLAATPAEFHASAETFPDGDACSLVREMAANARAEVEALRAEIAALRASQVPPAAPVDPLA